MLLIDLGNSSLKAQWWQADSLQASCNIRIRSGWQPVFETFLQTVETVDCYYATVPGSEAQRDLLILLSRYFSADNIDAFVSEHRGAGVTSAYRQSQRLGVDRWLALLGGFAVSDKDAIIVDAGSAITVDLLRKDGQHLGGAILPGMNTSLERFKTMLQVADFNHADIDANQLPGCSTESCIHINYSGNVGVYLGQLIDRWFSLLADDAVLIVSGGDASLVETSGQHALLHIPDLVFRGMRQQLESRE